MALALAEPRLVALLALLSALGWGASALAMPAAHHSARLGPLFLMWAAMMVGMMIPPEAPALLRLSSAKRGRFLAGFLAPWIAYSLLAAALQARLQQAGLLDHAMATTSSALAGAVLLAAGALQLSPLKRACLQRCRAPVPAERPLIEGLQASALSIGSCGLLMLVLFATGVMSVPAMVLLTLLLLVEHWLPRHSPLTTASGLLLVAAGAWKLVPLEVV